MRDLLEDNKEEKHYLEKIILENKPDCDIKIIEEVKKRLPEDFKVNSDDRYLTVEGKYYSNKQIAEKINMPIESILYTTTKRCGDYDNKIIYFCWDKIIDSMEILS